MVLDSVRGLCVVDVVSTVVGRDLHRRAELPLDSTAEPDSEEAIRPSGPTIYASRVIKSAEERFALNLDMPLLTTCTAPSVLLRKCELYLMQEGGIALTLFFAPSCSSFYRINHSITLDFGTSLVSILSVYCLLRSSWESMSRSIRVFPFSAVWSLVSQSLTPEELNVVIIFALKVFVFERNAVTVPTPVPSLLAHFLVYSREYGV